MIRAPAATLGWGGILRLGLVQTAIGAMAVLTTSVFNRVMVVELALPASLPAALIAWHYTVQLSRPRWGHRADRGGRRTPWILLGLAVLACGALLAASAISLLAGAAPGQRLAALAVAVMAYALIGAGIAAAGTSLLALMAARVDAPRRPAAAAIAWVMMILGIVLTAGISGQFLDPFSPARMGWVSAAVCALAVSLAVLALQGLEAGLAPPPSPPPAGHRAAFGVVLRSLWHDRLARAFTIFVFVSMLAYSAEELLIEPYAGLVFGFSLGRATQLAAAQHGGVLLGMALTGLAGLAWRDAGTRLMRAGAVLGCLLSALALLVLAAAGWVPHAAILPLRPMIFALGLANGVFAVSSLGWMMALAGQGRDSGEGVRMGVFGAAQALAFALGGLVGACGFDLLRQALGQAAPAFGVVFCAQALCFLAAAVSAWRLVPQAAVLAGRPGPRRRAPAAGGVLESPAGGA